MSLIRNYYDLIKPGIIYGNALPLVGGFLLASRGDIQALLLCAVCAGVALVASSGCVFNNLMDSDIDAKMERTKNRALVTGSVSRKGAIVYGVVLGLLGAAILSHYTNFTTFLVALIGFVFYVALYTPLKRRSVHAVLLGAVSGAVPTVAGYTAARGSFDMGALILFLIIFFWQLPHFFAIAIRRSDEYKAAGLPVAPLVIGMFATKVWMMFYITDFLVAAILLALYGFTGLLYFIVLGIVGAAWFALSIKGFFVRDEKNWARRMFLFSLIVITVFSIMISIDSFI